MANISRVGVDPKSGAQIIEQSKVFNENGDRNNALDIFYHYGTKLGSSAWIAPGSTTWADVDLYTDNTLTTASIAAAVDRDTGTDAFTSVDEDINVRVHFKTATFNLTHFYVRSDSSTWTVEASNDGTGWTLLTLGTPLSLGDDYYSIAVTNGLSYSYYRVRHGETGGVTKSLFEIKFYGTWNSGDFSFGEEENTQYMYAGDSSGGIIYIPDALAESFPENYYVVLINNQASNYSLVPHTGNTTTINDNIGGVLKPNLQAFIVFDGTEITINLQGGGATELTSKGQLLTVDNNSDLAALNPGADDTIIVADSAENLGLKYVNIFTNFAGTDPNKLVQLDGSSRLPAVDASLLTNLPIPTGSGSPLVALGDIYVHNGSNNVRLAVGADNSFLLADSGAPEGVSWNLVPSLTLFGSPTTSFSFNNQLLTSLAEPVTATDAATKGYVDSVAAGLDPKASCRIATTDDLDTETGNTWTPAGTGVGATLVQTGVDNATIDGYSLQLNDRVLVKNQLLGEDNGIYRVTSVTTNLVLTRATDFDGSPTNEVTGGAFTFVEGGTTQTNTGWVVSNTGTVIIDTTPITFVQFSGAETYPLSQLSDVDDSLSPSATDLLSYDGAQWTSESTGTAVGNILRIVDASGNPGLPALDGSNLTNLTVAAGQGSPLTIKGDIYIRDNSTNQRLPVGTDDFVLVPDSTTNEGLAYKEVREISRFTKLIGNEGAIDKTTVLNEGTIDVFYFLGTAEGTDTWQNPWQRGLVKFYNGATLLTNGNWVDQTTNGQTTSSSGFTIDLGTDSYLKLTTFSMLLNANYIDQNVEIRGGNDLNTVDTSGEVLFNALVTGFTLGSWVNIPVITINSYRYFWINTPSSLSVREMEIYGEVTSTTAQYTLKAEDEKATLIVPNVGSTSIVAPMGLTEGFYAFAINRDGGTIGVGDDGTSVVLGVNQSHNIGDVLMITNIGTDTWISSIFSNVALNNPGDLITHSTTGVEILPAPSVDNYRISNLVNSETGLIWRPTEPPSQVLFGDYLPYIEDFNVSSLDIIRYIATERNSTGFSNPGTSGQINVTGTATGTLTNMVDNNTSFITLDSNDSIILEFVESELRPTFVGVRINGIPSGTNVFNVQYATNAGGTNWTALAQFTIPDGGGGGLNLGVHIDDALEYWKWIRIIRDNGASTGTSCRFSEIKIFGDVIVKTPGAFTTLDSDGDRKVLNPPSYPKVLRYNFDNNELDWQGAEFYTQTSQAPTVVALLGNGTVTPDDISEYLYDNNGSSNPAPSLIAVGSSFGADDILTLTDQSTSGSGIYLGGTINPTTIYVDMKAGNTLAATYLGFTFQGTQSNVAFDIFASNNGTTWNPIGSWTVTNPTNTRIVAVTDNNPYRYFRFERGTLGNPSIDALIREMFLYGTYTLGGTIVDPITTSNINRTNYLNLSSNYQITIPNNSNDFVQGDYYRFVNTGLYNQIQIATDAAVVLFGQISSKAKGVTIINLDSDDNWLVIEDSVQGYGQVINEETVIADIVLDVTADPIQVIEPGGANRILTLPDPPAKNMYFKIVNADAANYTIDIEETLGGGSVQTLDVNTPYVECHYSGSQWIILS